MQIIHNLGSFELQQFFSTSNNSERWNCNVSAGDRWVFPREFFPFLRISFKIPKKMSRKLAHGHKASTKTKCSSSKFQHDGIVSSTVISCWEKKWTTLIQQLPFKVAIPKKNKKFQSKLVGGWTNPYEKNMKKYARQIESFPQFIGVKIPKNPWNHQPIQAFRLPPSWGAIQLVTSQRAWDEAQGSLFYSSVDKKCIPQYHSNLCMLKIACHHSTWIFLG